MSYPWELFLVFSSGVFAGGLYFSGLMLTIVKVRSVRRPGFFLMASFAFRAGLVLALFIAVSHGQWQRYLACLVGFLLARQLAIQLFRPRQGGSGEVKAWRS